MDKESEQNILRHAKETSLNFRRSLEDVCMDLHDIGTEVLRKKHEEQEAEFNKLQESVKMKGVQNAKLQK